MNSGRLLRAIFLGTPEFAVPSLRALRDKVELLAVLTQPDRPQGRGRKVAPPPGARVARGVGGPVLPPAKLSDPAGVEALRALGPGVIGTSAYGTELPPHSL